MFFNSIVPTPEGTLLPQQILELATIPLERAKKSGDHDIVPTFCHHVGAILSQLQGTTKTSATSTGPEEQIQHNPVAEVCFHLGKLMDDREYHEQAKAFYNKALELDSGILASSPLKMVSQPRILVQSNRHGEWSTGMLISCCGEGLRVDDHHRSQLGHQGAVIIPFTVGQEQEYITQYVSFHQDDATSDGECSCVLTGDHSALSCIFQNAGKQVDIPLEPEVANLSPARANLLRMATGKLVLFKYNPELGTALREAYGEAVCDKPTDFVPINPSTTQNFRHPLNLLHCLSCHDVTNRAERCNDAMSNVRDDDDEDDVVNLTMDGSSDERMQA
ncbi:hypothetical protein B0O80DRAFT_503239 [Mortierella sp. GBAus27b]|nr:hypothetical protein B0O80DRAFT_503239 [Mortierella sp. GBAus27b]